MPFFSSAIKAPGSVNSIWPPFIRGRKGGSKSVRLVFLFAELDLREKKKEGPDGNSSRSTFV